MSSSPLQINVEINGGDQMRQLSESMASAGSAASAMAQKFIASGMSAKDVEGALIGLGSSAKEAAATMVALGVAEEGVAVKTATAASSMGTFERAAATGAGRVAGAAVGLGAMGGALGRVAAVLPGVSEMFAVAFPITLIAFAIERIQQFREEIAKAVREDQELATASYSVAEAVQLENLKLEDQIAKLEGHPTRNLLKEALMEDQFAAEGLSKALAETMQKSNDLLTVGSISQLFSHASGDESGSAARLQPILNQLAAARMKLAEAPPGSDAQKAAINEQVELYKKLNFQINQEILNMEAAGTRNGQFINADSIAKLQDFGTAALNAGAALKGMNEQGALRTELGTDEQNKAVKDFWKSYSEGFAHSQEDLKRSDEMWRKFWADQIAEAAKSQSEMGKLDEEGAKERMDIMSRLASQETETNLQNAKADTQAILDEQKKQQAAKEGADVGQVGTFKEVIDTSQDRAAMAELQAQMGAVSSTMDRLKSDMAAINSQPFISEQDQKNLDKYNTAIGEQQKLLDNLMSQYQKLRQQVLTSMQQLQQGMEGAAQAGFSAFNSGFSKMLDGGQSFTRTMAQAWTAMADSFITSILKMGEKWITQHLLMAAMSKIFGATTTAANTETLVQNSARNVAMATSDANTGAALALATIPPPEGEAAAAAVFAEGMMYAAAASAEGGMVVPADNTLSVLHAQEMVLPASISKGLQGIIAGGGTGQGPSELHMHFAPKVSALDSSGVDKVLASHGKKFMRYFSTQMRNGPGAYK